MSDEQACETPLLELAKSVPEDLRAEWPIQWWEDGTPSGHAMAPVGRYVHDLVAEIERLTAELESMRKCRDHYWDAAENQLARSRRRKKEVERLTAENERLREEKKMLEIEVENWMHEASRVL